LVETHDPIYYRESSSTWSDVWISWAHGKKRRRWSFTFIGLLEAASDLYFNDELIKKYPEDATYWTKETDELKEALAIAKVHGWASLPGGKKWDDVVVNADRVNREMVESIITQLAPSIIGADNYKSLKFKWKAPRGIVCPITLTVPPESALLS
jgi:hypothetical protein